VVEIFDNLAKSLVKKFGTVAVEESSSLKPQINIREGRQGCCSRG
jgi:hypothetical protein